MPFSAEELNNQMDLGIGGDCIHSIEVKKVTCNQAIMSGLINGLSRLKFDRQAGGLQELILSSFTESLFPLDTQVIKQFVKQCRNLRKLHVTSMAFLT